MILRKGLVRPAMSGLAAVALLSGLSGSAYANIVLDGGFESAGTLGGLVNYTVGNSIDGGDWTVSEGKVAVDSQDFYVDDGNNSVFLDDDGGGPDSLSQTLNTVAGDTYTVSFWADADTPNSFSVTLGGTAVTGVPDSITANGFPSSVANGNSSLFELYSGTVVASSASEALVFTATGLSGGPGSTVEIDDVSVVDTTVPEPSTFAISALGLLGLIATGWRRRGTLASLKSR